MTVDVLISCMYQKDWSIVAQSHLNGNAVIINQCDTDSHDTYDYEGNQVRMISTTERGLSRSRNMAILHSNADICLISDDDEIYTDNYVDIITKAFTDYPHADVISFQIGNDIGKTFSPKPFKVGYLGALKIASCQIAFRRKSVIEAGILFDVEMGAGTGHGSGEEIKFLFDCLKHGLCLQYVPIEIAKLIPGSASSWFQGFNTKYFVNRGWATARYMGKFMATCYALYFAVRKYSIYHKDHSMIKAFYDMLKGIYCNPYKKAKD